VIFIGWSEWAVDGVLLALAITTMLIARVASRR
jgi:hypothetical protein